MDTMKNEQDYITLGQFLKLKDYVSSGGEAKHLIRAFSIQVNGEDENRRGKKLRNGDEVIINNTKYVINDIHED